ncbi:hypothetical protein [Rhizobium sp. C1]|uniref:hypothetical protein n=1 Tax=Rhizobium sp. C1 TaxID=1349799 RepID=UPI001E63E99A|nr:hypothetical protein [Rhizobium sp. C1]MCD2179597.1 hypothetical protein [Rhizobium sp. C1]
MDETTRIQNSLENRPANTGNQHERYRAGSPLSNAVEEWLGKLVKERSRIAIASAAEARERYRLARAVEGKTVRGHTYHKHAPQQFGESRQEYERRIHRDAQRARRHANSKPSRGWTDLSTMTAEEKAEHQRVKANERKAKERRRKADMQNNAASLPDVAEIHPDDDSWGMF